MTDPALQAQPLLAMARPSHPLRRMPSDDEIIDLVGRLGLEETTRRLGRLYDDLAAELLLRDPFRNPAFEAFNDGWVMPQWLDALRELDHCRLLYFGGGRRASKSQCCAWMLMKSIEKYPGGFRWCISDSEATSKATQQPAIWHYLQRRYRANNMRESPLFKIKWQEGRGFTDMLLVLDTRPVSTTIQFLTKNQRVTDYQGWAIGGRDELAQPGAPWPNIACWIDEDISQEWLQTAMDRASDRAGKIIWSFTPLRGITQAVRELIGSSPQLLESRPAALLAQDRRAVREFHDLPPGHMPYRIACARPRTRAIFFFKDCNPWSGYDGWVKENTHLDEQTVQREAYGWSREIRGRAFPRFGSAHLLATHELPAIGTNYRFVDPHADRMWAIIWVRVWPAAGGRLKRVIYRDWPDQANFGEWAIPTQRAEEGLSQRGADGDVGPAQEGRGFGIVDYKRALLAAETIPLALEQGRLTERDPYRVRLLENALASVGLQAGPTGLYTQGQIEAFRQLHPEPIREEIAQSFFDPRAMANPQAAEKGGTTLADLMAVEHRDQATARVVGPAMLFDPAFSGKGIDDGCDHVNDLLAWDQDHPDGLVRDYNDPRLYVCTLATQVRWMFDHYTGLAGPKGACKEWADLARYLSQTDLMHYQPGTLGSRGGGSY